MLDQCVLVNISVDVPSTYEITGFEFRVWDKFPFMLVVECRHVNATWDENILAHFVDCGEGSLDAVENGVEDSWTQFYGEGVVGSDYLVAQC